MGFKLAICPPNHQEDRPAKQRSVKLRLEPSHSRG